MMKQENFREKSFWLTTRDYTPGPSLGADLEVDVAIIGGGFTGLSTAYHLKRAEPSLRVAILEGQVIGFGASGRNGGFNMTLFGLTLGITALRFGKEKAREAHHYMERAVDLLRARVTELGLDCDYEHPGFLRVATSEKYKRRIQEEIALAQRLGLEGIEWIDAHRLAAEVRSPLYLGAWWEPRCGILNPAKLAWSWKDLLVRMGVVFYENSPVAEIQRHSGGITLSTPGGRVRAERLVMATNAWSHCFPALRRKQIPVWTHIVLTEPLTEAHFEAIGWRNRQGIEDARNLVHYYRLTADNRLLMGGRDVSLATGEDMDRDLDPPTFAGLKEDVHRLFPALKDIRFTHEWGGPVSVPLDMAPALGYLGDRNVVYSLGCVGHGVSLTHLNGQTLADMVLQRKTDLTEVFFVNRRTLPWPPGVMRQAVVRAILGYMHWEDRRFDAPAGPARR
jgi:glycine/D-amino acid oxidase-like deaminating enzyme